MNDKLIGIIGGVGPYAGLNLAQKVLEETKARTDQEHLPMVLFSMPDSISDRTDFLLGKTKENPAYSIYSIINKMEQAGVKVAGIACNTAHAPQIYNVILEKLKEANCKVKLVNMIEEVANFIYENYPQTTNVGVLSSTGAYEVNLYKEVLLKRGFNVVLPCKENQEIVNSCIYDVNFGIKSNPSTNVARKGLYKVITEFIEKNNNQAIILGCTEISIAIPDKEINGAIIIDSTFVLARALIRESAPNKLKKISPHKSKVVTLSDPGKNFIII